MVHNKQARRLSAAAVSMLSLAGIAAVGFSTAASAADPVVFSFATVGDSRTDPAAPDPTTKIPGDNGVELAQDQMWVQNTKAFSRILRTIQTEKANILFFNGDMIYGYGRALLPPAWQGDAALNLGQIVGSDLVQHYTQYAYWRGMVANSFETNTYVIPVPGNHETQCSNTAAFDPNVGNGSNCATGKLAYAENEQAFVVNMGDLIQDLVNNTRFQTVTGFAAQNVMGTTNGTAPQIGTNGGLSTTVSPAAQVNITSNQANLTYSFDLQVPNSQVPGGNMLLHFAVINTDPSGADGIAPSAWLATDLAAAKSRATAAGEQAKYFVFGHKPAYTYNYTSAATIAAGGLDVNPVPRDAFWSVIAQYNASYFAGHEHTVNVSQHTDPSNATTNNPYQVIVGSGGSPFDDKMAACTLAVCPEPFERNPTDRDYAWALVQVHQSGTVTMTVYGFTDTWGATQTLLTVPSLQ